MSYVHYHSAFDRLDLILSQEEINVILDHVLELRRIGRQHHVQNPKSTQIIEQILPFFEVSCVCRLMVQCLELAFASCLLRCCASLLSGRWILVCNDFICQCIQTIGSYCDTATSYPTIALSPSYSWASLQILLRTQP